MTKKNIKKLNQSHHDDVLVDSILKNNVDKKKVVEKVICKTDDKKDMSDEIVPTKIETQKLHMDKCCNKKDTNIFSKIRNMVNKWFGN